MLLPGRQGTLVIGFGIAGYPKGQRGLFICLVSWVQLYYNSVAPTLVHITTGYELMAPTDDLRLTTFTDEGCIWLACLPGRTVAY